MVLDYIFMASRNSLLGDAPGRKEMKRILWVLGKNTQIELIVNKIEKWIFERMLKQRRIRAIFYPDQLRGRRFDRVIYDEGVKLHTKLYEALQKDD